MSTFVINTKAEFLKNKGTRGTLLLWVAAGFVPLMFLLAYLMRAKQFEEKLSKAPWKFHFDLAAESAALFLLPMMLILINALVMHVEARNNTWKQVFLSPRSYADIYFSRLVVVHIAVFAYLLMFLFCTVITGYAAGIFHGSFTFLTTPVPWNEVLSFYGHLYIAAMGMIAIQYNIGLIFKNQIIAIGSGMALLVTGWLMFKTDINQYFPYDYTGLTYQYFGRANASMAHESYSLLFYAVITLLGFWYFVKQKERG